MLLPSILLNAVWWNCWYLEPESAQGLTENEANEGRFKVSHLAY